MIYARQPAGMRKIIRLRAARPGVLALLPALFIVTACGGNITSNDGVATAESSSAKGSDKDQPGTGADQAAQKRLQDAYLSCMRKNGINLPDIKPGQGLEKPSADSGYYDSDGENGVSELGHKADKACEPDRVKMAEANDKLAADPKAEAEGKKKLQKYADCLRSKGVKVNDPKDSGALFDDAGKALEDSEFKAADPVCRQQAYGNDGAQE
ncbi:hypothetical protein [Streptomyces sp. x-19]|uniref:hypothetical protein n=1 Tax=Streptomyces sp. x-19 TaxID=2789280 RepID=UPI0039809351